MSKEKLMIIDGSSLLFRAFYALPLLNTKEGIYTNGVYGFLTMFYRIIKEKEPDYMAVAFDRSGPTFRNEIFKDYKSSRTAPPAEIKDQFSMLKEILEAMKIPALDSQEYEADDIAGTLAKNGEKKDLEVILVTGDMDYLQLATDNTEVIVTRRGITETEKYNREGVIEKYGITPEQFIDLNALKGDPSDDIPGVPGIGEKTGLTLIKDYGSLDGVYENIEEISGPKRRESLIENKEIAYLSKKLFTIITDLDLNIELEDLKYEEPDYDKLEKLYKRYEFNSFLRDYINPNQPEKEVNLNLDYEFTEDISKLIKDVKAKGEFAFTIIRDGEDPRKSQPIYLGLKAKGEDVKILDISEETQGKFNQVKDLFEDEKLKAYGHDVKDDIVTLFEYGIDIANLAFDTMLAEYLIDPSHSDGDVNDIAEKYLSTRGYSKEELLGKGRNKKTFSQIDKKDLGQYIAFKLNVVEDVIDELNKSVIDLEMEQLYYDIELPLIEVLASLQHMGFKVDPEELNNLDELFQKELEELTEEIYEMAGREFNINSPKQLGEILFEDLKLPVIKRTKTGYSTGAEVLKKLENEHPIIFKIYRYRELAKLKSTYIDGMLKLIDEDTGRIHSTFNQTIAITGRISSTEPNLQNIPIRTEDGRRIRKAFVAEEGTKLVDADYSQIELRILAHISEDEEMINAFKNGEDIHTKTASEVFNIPAEEIGPRLRDEAKAVNFGIVYGISDYGLSEDLEITRAEAKEYIDNYLNHYKDVKRYMKKIVEYGKEHGYVETLFHRRRYLPELNEKNFFRRSFAERAAINTPIQGSAADIIKIAMVRVYHELNKRNLKSRLILQIHDELMIETFEDELDEVKDLIVDIMDSVMKLNVPLIAEVKIGDSWYETL